jgi:hypothetical protein
MALHDYFASISEELRLRSERVRFNFSTHRPSAGDNRESIVADFLREHLPKAFGVHTGLVLAKSGEFSNQADIIIVDHLNNSPLYSTSPEHIWLIESVYALIEVKTSFPSPKDLAECIEKCRRFKALPREFSNSPSITESLYILWAFESSSAETVKDNFLAAIKDIPPSERPDFIVISNLVIIKSGSYYELIKIGQEGSPQRKKIMEDSGGDMKSVLGNGIEAYRMDQNVLLAWFIWLNSWLEKAGPRRPILGSYLPKEYIYGKVI